MKEKKFRGGYERAHLRLDRALSCYCNALCSTYALVGACRQRDARLRTARSIDNDMVIGPRGSGFRRVLKSSYFFQNAFPRGLLFARSAGVSPGHL